MLKMSFFIEKVFSDLPQKPQNHPNNLQHITSDENSIVCKAFLQNHLYIRKLLI